MSSDVRVINLYVYYEVPAIAATTARARVARLFDDIAPPAARLQKRADTNIDGRETWMEIYEGVDEGFERRLDDAVARLGVTALTGPRHVERFVAFD